MDIYISVKVRITASLILSICVEISKKELERRENYSFGFFKKTPPIS